MASASLFSCRWDWCRSSFMSISALDTHVKHEHIWPMKPMRKADIALMRRMDLQSLHSSLDTDSSFISRGLMTEVSRNKTPPLAAPPMSSMEKRPEHEAFDTLVQPSSPPQTHSPQRLPVSPSLEALVRQNGHSGLSAAVEIFERTYAHKANQHFRLPSRQRSPMRRPLSQSSASSQEVVEQQLTQEDDVGSQPQPLLPSELHIENELIDTELRWPTDDELGAAAAEETQTSKQPVSEEDSCLGISADSARGRNFRCGSLSVPLGDNSNSASSPHPSPSQNQSIALQTQAPYSSQATGWSQT